MKQLSNLEISSFCGELAWLIHSGVSVGDGLMLMAEEEEDSGWRESLRKIAEYVESGKAISEAVKEAACFPVYVQGSISVGEKTGRLEEALKALTTYYEEKERMNRRVRSAILYPAFLLLLLLLVLGVLLTQILPTFQSVYASLGGKMTGGAGVVLKFGMWMKEKLPVLCVLLGVIIGVVILIVLCAPIREKLVRLWKKWAGDRGVMRKMNDAALAQVMSMGLSSGMVLEETMDLAAEVMADVPKAQKRCLLCKEELLKGIPLVEALKTSEVLPTAACRLLSVGMQGGNGDSVMEELAEKLSEEADTALASRVAKVEPMLVLVTSILVGLILLMVMLPLINIMETIG